jgi:hypothetical protein
VKDGAVVEGSIAFKGEAPAPKKITMGKDIDVCGLDPVTGKKSITRESKELLVKNGRIANAIVYLEGITKGKAWKVPPGEFVIDQKNCDFAPRVSAFSPGEITVVNSDGPPQPARLRRAGAGRGPIGSTSPSRTRPEDQGPAQATGHPRNQMRCPRMDACLDLCGHTPTWRSRRRMERWLDEIPPGSQARRMA